VALTSPFWSLCSRKIKDEVRKFPELYTLIYLPHPIMVPGGRFREMYYWDSFWIIRGLIVCDMLDTVCDLLLNYVHFIKAFGFIPNGGRTYYLNRSHPPLFIHMVDEYLRASGNEAFLEENFKYMTQEMAYWESKHFVTILAEDAPHSMARYCCEDEGPRPESYYEDYELATECCGEDKEARAELYWEMKTGAESGWDYSSRWFIPRKEGKAKSDLGDTRARFILPVDLNAILQRNFSLLATYAEKLGKVEAAHR